ncbi:MAG TPA: AtpZ/AtpI family protein [Clostridia bacterium]|nr:AtpZ/AtpI family protein [Clostridia bacterium]
MLTVPQRRASLYSMADERDQRSTGRSEPAQGDDKQSPWVQIARYSEIGFTIPAAVLLGFFVGKALDYWLHTHWLYLAGVVFGAIAGFVSMIRMALSSDDAKR